MTDARIWVSGQIGIVRDLVVQMVFAVGERVADQARRRAFQRAPQRVQIGADRFRRTALA